MILEHKKAFIMFQIFSLLDKIINKNNSQLNS
jgi:hypothetical protein